MPEGVSAGRSVGPGEVHELGGFSPAAAKSFERFAGTQTCPMVSTPLLTTPLGRSVTPTGTASTNDRQGPIGRCVLRCRPIAHAEDVAGTLDQGDRTWSRPKRRHTTRSS